MQPSFPRENSTSVIEQSLRDYSGALLKVKKTSRLEIAILVEQKPSSSRMSHHLKPIATFVSLVTSTSTLLWSCALGLHRLQRPLIPTFRMAIKPPYRN